jgi:hypothetical protein
MRSVTKPHTPDPNAAAPRIVGHDREALDELGPDEHLLSFFRNLSPDLKTELSLEIMRGMGRRTGRGPPELATEQLMLARYGVLLRRRTILMTGLIDHYLAVKADDEPGKVRFFGSISPWREARAIWLELRSKELSPTMIANLKRYRGKRGRQNK